VILKLWLAAWIVLILLLALAHCYPKRRILVDWRPVVKHTQPALVGYRRKPPQADAASGGASETLRKETVATRWRRQFAAI
jgi:hypothetical protein